MPQANRNRGIVHPGGLGHSFRMEPLIVVQNNPLVQRMTAPVAIHARRRGIDLLDIDLNEDTDLKSLDLDLDGRDRILVYGSVGLLAKAMGHPILSDHLHWHMGAFQATEWVRAFGEAYVGYEGRVMTAGEVGRSLGWGRKLAVRPEVGLKSFRGGVYGRVEWEAEKVPDWVDCFAMPPSRLLREHRVWFVAGEPIAASRYMAEGRLSVGIDRPEEVMAVAARLVGSNLPLEDVVVDVAETPEGWRIVELNCIHTAGWYAAKAGDVVDALLERPGIGCLPNGGARPS